MKSVCTRGTAPAGRVDGRAATACSCGAESDSPVFGGARRRVSSFSRGRERRRPFSSVGRSLRLCVRNVVFVYANPQTWWLLLLLRDRPRLRQRPGGGHSSPLRGVSVKAALSVVFQGSSTVPRSARALPQSSRSTNRTVVSLDRGSRVGTGSGLRKQGLALAAASAAHRNSVTMSVRAAPTLPQPKPSSPGALWPS